MTRLILSAIACIYLFGSEQNSASAANKPNVLIIMADDLGFSDLGCYGSEIETPNLDRLAANGLRFSQFYNTAKCHSSRISLLTGRYAFQAGNTSLTRAVTTAEVLGRAGYSTAMVGKWHLDGQPTDFGFERYFGHLSGACNYFKGDNTFRLNGQPWKVPAEGFYTTVANVDYALKFLTEARQTEKPWYFYVAFNAPHAPLQPLEWDYKKYLGRYDVGWDVIREARLKKQSALGLFGNAIEPSPRPEHVSAWNELSPTRRNWESRRMAAYAALIDRVDQELGRLVANLERTGELENTFILFVSDNGACPYDRRHVGMDCEPYRPDTTWSDSTGWAWARNAPFRFYKQNQFEGGIATPGIVHWPAGLKAKSGEIVHDPVHLVDVLPTVADLAGASLPTEWPGRDLEPVSGISFSRVLNGQPLGARPPIHLLFGSDRGLRDGDWKLVSFQSNPWELYNLATDRAELHDVAAKHPEIRDRMANVWHQMTEDVLHAPANAQEPVQSTAKPSIHREWTDFAEEPSEVPRQVGAKGKRAASNSNIRGRVAKKLAIEGNQLVLTCTGSDSGLAMNSFPSRVGTGPHVLSFRLNSQASDTGEIYFTTDAKTTLHRGQRVEFDVTHDGQWHEHTLKLDTTQTIHVLRLDPCSGPGIVRIESLQLADSAGKVLHQWPAESQESTASEVP